MKHNYVTKMFKDVKSSKEKNQRKKVKKNKKVARKKSKSTNLTYERWSLFVENIC